jgi:arginase
MMVDVQNFKGSESGTVTSIGSFEQGTHGGFVMQQQLVILQAPSALGLRTDGVTGLGPRLLELGLAERIGARTAAPVPVPVRDAIADAETGILNLQAITEFSPRLADAVGTILDAGGFPILLGGDCTILLGPMLALRRRGRYGLLFIDGHADFFQPEAEPNGEGASMEMAWATGYGPDRLTDLEGLRPLMRSADAVSFGFRDHEDQREYNSQPLPSDLLVCDLPRLKQVGIVAAAQAAVDRLTRPELDGFFIHLDADVLDDAIMPAVDFRIPDGLSWEDVTTVLRAALASGKAVGIEVTIYNPTLDRDGSAGRGLVDVLARALGRRGED